MMEECICQFYRIFKNYKNSSENTIVAYKEFAAFHWLFENHSVTNLEKVSQTSIMSYIYELQKNNRAASTVSRNIASLKAFFHFLLSDGKIKKNPTIGLESPKVEKRMPEILSLPKVELLLAQPEEKDLKGIRDKAMLEVLYATGSCYGIDFFKIDRHQCFL